MGDHLFSNFYFGKKISPEDIVLLLEKAVSKNISCRLSYYVDMTQPKVAIDVNSVPIDHSRVKQFLSGIDLRTISLGAGQGPNAFLLDVWPDGFLGGIPELSPKLSLVYYKLGPKFGVTDVLKNSEQLFDYLSLVCEALGSRIVYGRTNNDYNGQESNPDAATEYWLNSVGGLDFGCWLFPWTVFYSGQLFDKQTLELIAKAPAYRTASFSGGVLLMVTPVPRAYMPYGPSRLHLEELTKYGDLESRTCRYFDDNRIFGRMKKL